jgi:translation initiation factor IF-2
MPDKALVFRAFWTVFFSRIQIWFSSPQKFLSEKNPVRPAPQNRPALSRVIWSVIATSKRMPFCSNCLVRAVAAKRLLSFYGYPADLRIGVAKSADGKAAIKAMIDPNGKRVLEALPSSPVRVSGLSAVPVVGDILQVVPSEKEARALQESLSRSAGERRIKSFSDLVSRLSEGKLTQLKVVLKADAQGSLEAIIQALSKLGAEDPENPTSVKVIHSAVGAVSESDVMIAAASSGIVLAFHSAVPPEVQRAAEREGVKIREYVILYELLDEVEKLLHSLIEPEEKEQILGHMEIKAVFYVKKSDQIVGGRVTDGIVKRVLFRLVRNGEVIDHGRIVSLKHVDKDIKEAKEGTECGMKIDLGTPVQEKDILEVYMRELKRKDDAK